MPVGRLPSNVHTGNGETDISAFFRSKASIMTNRSLLPKYGIALRVVVTPPRSKTISLEEIPVS